MRHPMRVSAKADYAVRAASELARAAEENRPVKGERVADAQGIPLNFLENILGDLRQAGIVRSQRGPEGGYWLARPADQISLADIIRAIDGPLVGVRGERPEHLGYEGPARALQVVWIALRASERAILEQVTLADVASGELPPAVHKLTEDPAAWDSPAFRS
jgi:Rrf2 family protein